jgi:maltooligosyltrehalose trehalohydrolase
VRYEGTLAELARCIAEGWLHGTPARDRPAWQFLYALQNHDQVGNRALGERLHHEIGLERFAAASALFLFLPSTPMLFMGQEFGASTPFQFFTDHNPELGRLVTEGRRREFKAFTEFARAATRERIPDPQAESTFLASKLRLSEADVPPGSELQAWYRSLIALRRSDPVLCDQSRDRMSAMALNDDVLAVRRWLPDRDERLLVVNFGESVYATEEFGASWKATLASNEATFPTQVGLQVAPRSALIVGRGPQ